MELLSFPCEIRYLPKIICGLIIRPQIIYIIIFAIILQWGKIVYGGTHNFPIEFPTKCLTLVVGNVDQQGGRVDNVFGYIIDNWILTV